VQTQDPSSGAVSASPPMILKPKAEIVVELKRIIWRMEQGMERQSTSDRRRKVMGSIGMTVESLKEFMAKVETRELGFKWEAYGEGGEERVKLKAVNNTDERVQNAGDEDVRVSVIIFRSPEGPNLITW
jgi:hypothetical protein